MDKEIIIRNFSRRAHTYDLYAAAQTRCALGLLSTIRQDSISNILEIGCGTGNYTFFLGRKFPRAKIRAIDISAKMIDAAAKKLQGRMIELEVGDGEKIELNEKFDLITSNACFQWFGNLGAALNGFKNSLKEGGSLIFSIFGPDTFLELNKSLETVFHKKTNNSTNFLNMGKLREIMNDNFNKVTIEEFRFEDKNSSLRELLNKIKYTGTKGEGFFGRISFTPKSLRKLEEAYLSEFNSITATYQVFFCKGIK